MEMNFKTTLAVLAAAIANNVGAVTAGWENVNATRGDIGPARILWTADFADGASFEVERRNGAEGYVSFGSGTMTVEKTNDEGYVIVRAKPCPAATNQAVRVSADVNVSSGDYFYAQASVRAHGLKERLSPFWKIDTLYFSCGGAEEMQGAVNSAPGMFYRKYSHYRAEEGVVVPVIIVGGTRSRTTWRDWRIEDLLSADTKWAGYYEAKSARDRAEERMDDESFGRILESDVEHTAKLAKPDGVTRLVVDGKAVPAVAYRSKGSFGKDALFETFAGGSIVSMGGVKLVVKSVSMGGGFGNEPRRYWTKRGYDAKGAAEDIRNSLRLAPDALCILGLSCNAYPEFTLKEHPDEVWRLKDGTVVKGTAGSCEADYHDMGIKDTNRWPWVSYASPAWREAVKANIRALVAELRRQGLAKRVVGVHLSGYHDGQFYSPYEDHSRMAKAEYERYLRDCPVAVKDFAYFSKVLGFRAQEDFAREFKRAMGKDVIAIRWCMGPFSGAADLTAFVFSDVIDICVPQPTYETRRPAMAAEPKLPFSSFDRHCKMYWNELDLRTYNALESWAAPGVVATKGLGQSDDFAMWRTVYRKFAGLMMARRSGYWFYDMGGGWFDSPEIANDIGSVVRIDADLLSKPPSAWRPQVAVVADEQGLGVEKRRFTANILRRQLMLLAASGVPYDFWLAEDALRTPSLLSGAKTVVFAFFRSFDERRKKIVDALARDGRTLVFLSESGSEGGAEATGFRLVSETGDRQHQVKAVDGCSFDVRSMMLGERRRYFPGGPDAIVSGPRTVVIEDPGVEVMARFTPDGAPALAMRQAGDCRKVYVCEPAGLTASCFNWLARTSGAYVPVSETGLQVDMNGDFVSVHALRNGAWDFMLPFACKVTNLRSGCGESVENGIVRLSLTAGETCWLRMDADRNSED